MSSPEQEEQHLFCSLSLPLLIQIGTRTCTSGLGGDPLLRVEDLCFYAWVAAPGPIPTGPRDALKPSRFTPLAPPSKPAAHPTEILQRPKPPLSTIPDSQEAMEGVVFDVQGLNASRHAPSQISLPPSPPPVPRASRPGWMEGVQFMDGNTREVGLEGSQHASAPGTPLPPVNQDLLGFTQIDAQLSLPRGRRKAEKEPCRTPRRSQGSVEKEKENGQKSKERRKEGGEPRAQRSHRTHRWPHRRPRACSLPLPRSSPRWPDMRQPRRLMLSGSSESSPRWMMAESLRKM
jgi:hypothetical protein